MDGSALSISERRAPDRDEKGDMVAVIGCGYWGKNLVRNFAALDALAALVDSDTGRLAVFAQTCPDIPRLVDLGAVLDMPEVRAVAIATPVATHYRLTRRALEAGKDVFVEKPLALTLPEAEELVHVAHRRGRILMVGHILRYHPALRRLKELVDEGALGKLQYIYSNRLNLGRIRTEENILWSFAPHDISAMLYLLGEEPVRVTAHGGAYLNPDLVDVTTTTLEFAGGVRGHIFVSWLHPYKEQRLVVVGDRGMAVFDDLVADRKLQFFRHEVAWKGRVPTARAAQAEVIPQPDVEPLRAECEHFLECVRTRRNPETDGPEGVRVLRVLAACEQSLRGGGAPVRIASPPRSSYFAHETAVIDQPCEIGEGTKIWHFSHIMPGAWIGRHCSIGQNVVIASGVVIGDNAKIQNNVSVYEGVTLEDDVFCGPSMVFTNVINPRSAISRKSEYQQTLVRRGATLGANCTIVCGHTIGRYAFVGAGAVVTRDVSDYALVMGSPARHVGWMCQCGVRLKDEGQVLSCPACSLNYRETAAGLQPLEVEMVGATQVDAQAAHGA